MPQTHPATSRALSLLLCCAAVGCSSEPAEIGDGPLEVDKTQLSSYAAAWDGYIEAHEFESGSDRVRVTLDEAGNGWLQVGDGDLLPPPTDPDVGYPEEVRQAAEGGREPLFWNLYAGLAYSIEGAVVDSERLRFDSDAFEPYGEWCELQTPKATIGVTPSGYSCVAHSGWSTDAEGECTTVESLDGEWIPMDCSKIMLCISACECTETACHGLTRTYSPITADAALSDDGEELTGTLLLPEIDGDARTIRLQRVE